MAELKAGVIGCAICIFALMGSIFGASLMTADNVDTPITTYEYITDVTGAFDTTQAPEYISYNPAANYVGYSMGTMNYTASTTPNAYRYIVSYPKDITIDRTIDEISTVNGTPQSFWPSEVQTRVIMNYTGGNELGTATTVDGMTYNGVAVNQDYWSLLHGTYNSPSVTRLNYILVGNFSNPDASGNISIDISQNGNQPLLMSPLSAYTSVALSDGDENVWYIYHVDITAKPTRLVWNYNTDMVTVYNNSTVLFTENLYNIDTFYTYQYDTGGTITNANVNTVLSHTGTASQSVTVTNNSSYTNYNPVDSRNLYINNIVSIGSLPTTPTANLYGSYDYNLYNQYYNDNRGITSLQNIISSFNIPSNTHATINITNNGNPIIFCYSINNIGATQDYLETSSSNFPYVIDYATNGNLTIYYHPSGSPQSRVAYTGTGSDVYLIYKYMDSNNNSFSTNTTFSCAYSYTETTTITNASNNTVAYGTFEESDAGTTAIMDWNGTFDMGTGGTYAGINYKIVAERYYRAGSSSPYNNRIPEIFALSDFLSANLLTYPLIDINVEYDTDYPVLFYYGTWTRTEHVIGGQTQYIYSTTLNEDNSMPDRFHIIEGSAQAYRDGILLYTAPLSSIYVINKYSVNEGTGFDTVDTYAHFDGVARKDSEAVNITVTNSSNYPADAYNFGATTQDISTYILPYMRYTGTQYNNLGTSTLIEDISKYANLCLKNGDNEHDAPALKATKLSNILEAIGLANYDSLDLQLTYGTHPVIFIQGDWEYYAKMSAVISGGSIPITIFEHFYWKEFDDNAFPDRLTYNKATEIVSFYKNGVNIWNAPATQVQVIYKYWTLDSQGDLNEVTNQSVSMSGTGKLHPTYGYANPEFGVTLKTNGMTTWKNGYENDVINILWYSTDSTHQNDLTITADTSTITVTRATNGQVTVDITRADNTTETRNMGTWNKGQITIDVTNHTVSFTPITGSERPNFTDSPIELNSTTYTWTDWYIGNPIEELTISTTGYSLNFGVTGTSVFLDTYGVVMFDPTLDITDYFPELTEWRLNFFSFALVGDSVTINNVVYPINKADNTITVVDADNHSLTGTLNNVYLTKENTHGSSDPHYFFTFANTNKTVDLGAVETDTVSFQGMWYFTTGLYELGEGTAKIWSWVPSINIDLNLIALFYIGMMAAALVIGKGILHADIGGLDWVILISTSFIALIVAGGVI